MVPICIGTVIMILSDWCDIGVVRSENLKKLHAFPAGRAPVGVISSMQYNAITFTTVQLHRIPCMSEHTRVKQNLESTCRLFDFVDTVLEFELH